jgi:DMSO reductase anchor subunit
MNYEFPLVIFTALTQFAVGLALFAAWKSLRCAGSTARECEDISAWRSKDWMVVFLLAAFGLAASLFHLAQPLRAAEALGHLSVSWLSREGLVFGIFTVLALVNVFRESRCLSVLAALAGLAGIVAQGFTYAPVAMPAVSNGVPMLLFLLSALALGSAAGQMNGSHDFSTVFRTSCAALLAVLLIVPCLWTSGGAVMQASAELWMQSWIFWAGLGLLALAFIVSLHSGAEAALPCLALVLGGVVLTRIVFFCGTVHTAVNLGMPY